MARDHIEAVKGGSQCHFCAEDHPAALDFHHINPEEKLFRISNSWKRYGVEKVASEIAKCVLVCKNCHAKIHAGALIYEETDRRDS
jgi:hypothetical protein